ncbi:hypothetical protein [Methyloraptor flagellatus]|uniref:Uncharacterized protein n=1 Tax=Methyloraptor flagellatus TaxID=3162530 RepID=A0AAU7X5M7_9HYPH
MKAAGPSLLVLLALTACGRPTGDFDRAAPSVLHDNLLPAVGDIVAKNGREELVSGFNRTDNEVTLRDRAWALVQVAHARDWFGLSLTEGQRTRILPEIDQRFDPNGYYNFLRKDKFRSSEARWNRLLADIRADTGLIGPFWAEVRKVKADDDQRIAALNARRDLSPTELYDAYARVDENARVVDWVWRAMRFRVKAYRIAIDRMQIETPTERLYEINSAWGDLQAAIAEAELASGAAFANRGGPPERHSRYSTGAGIQEKVPQK